MRRTLTDRAGWAIAGALALLLVAALAGVVRSGPLDPPGTPGPTLPQVEPRMPVPPADWNGSFPIAIIQPGSYFLTRDLTGVSGADGITVNTSGDVSLDLGGFSLRGAADSGQGINVIGVGNLEIGNGTVAAWPYGGIRVLAGEGVRIHDIAVAGNGGIGLNLVVPALVEDCRISNHSNNGINMKAGTVSGCVLSNNYIGINTTGGALLTGNNVAGSQYYGIATGANGGNTIRDNSVVGVGSSAGIYADGPGNLVEGNNVSVPGFGIWIVNNNNTVSGNRVSSSTTDAIFVGGAYNRIDGNHAASSGEGWAFLIIGTGNVVIRNSATASTGDYSINPGNDAAPIQTAATSTNPWANIAD